MGPGFGPPVDMDMKKKLAEPKPKSIKEVPRYIKNVLFVKKCSIFIYK